MSHLGTGGESYRLVPSPDEGGLRFVGSLRATPDIQGAESVGELTRAARAVGINLGDAREEDENYLDNVRHEAAHAACAYSLGWSVVWCDARAGNTGINAPDIMSQSINDRHLQHSVIAASAKAFTGSWQDRPFEDDRFQVRNRGHIDFEAAQRKAEKLAADPWVKGIYNRLIDALLAGPGRLAGDELQRVLEGE